MTDFSNDHWTTDLEVLGYTPFARRVRDLILDAKPPFALTIGGRWGSGKTSMLLALMRALRGDSLNKRFSIYGAKNADWPTGYDDSFPLDPDKETDPVIKNKLQGVKTVWFNPWQYQFEAHPVVPLLQEIRRQVLPDVLKESDDDFLQQRAALEGKRTFIGKLVDDLAKVAIPVYKGKISETVGQSLDAAETQRRETLFLDPVVAQRLNQAFEMVVRTLVDPAGTDPQGRLVLFIDDLDRCHNETVFRLLEAIRMFLNSDRCLFVFGLDRAHVERAVADEAKYSRTEAFQYVDKLFQARLFLPVPKEDNLRDFISKLLGKDLPSGLTQELFKLLPPNPRFIKNFINGFKLYREVTTKPDGVEEDIHLKCLAYVHFIRQLLPDIYELLAQNPAEIFPPLTMVCRSQVQTNRPLHQYIVFLLANPLMEADATAGDGTHPPFDDDRFRDVRGGAWLATSIKHFKGTFPDIFCSEEGDQEGVEDKPRIGPYLYLS